jgi:pimeloyl-ACP methyl ester carboxylesterase
MKKLMLVLQKTSKIILFCSMSSAVVSGSADSTVSAEKTLSPFSYCHKTELVFQHEPGVELGADIEQFALKKNKYLNHSLYFDTSFIIDTPRVRAHHLKNKPNKGDIGQIIDLLTEDDALIGCTYFDRGSDKLLIVGEGFTNEREKMTPFVDMFDCDVVLFDFRGHGYEKFDFFDIDSWPLNLAKASFGMDSSVSRLAAVEEKDVFAVVKHFSKKKNYKQVSGIALCYSAFIFLKAAVLKPGLFDKLILDGTWLSIPMLIEKIKRDPKMLCVPQRGGWKNSWLWKKEWAQDGLIWFAANVWNLDFNDFSLLEYLPQLHDTSLLFFYGKNDLLVNREEWEQIWSGITHVENKAAIVTSNPHVINHLKQKEFYKLACDTFLDLNFAQFKACLTDSNKLVEYEKNKLTELLLP